MTAYQSIGVDEESAQNPRGPKRNNDCIRYIVICFLTLALITTSFHALTRRNDGKEKSADTKYYSTKASSTNVPMPTGVNLGSWVRNSLVYHFQTQIAQSSLTHIIRIIYSHAAVPRRLVLRW